MRIKSINRTKLINIFFRELKQEFYRLLHGVHHYMTLSFFISQNILWDFENILRKNSIYRHTMPCTNRSCLNNTFFLDNPLKKY